MPVNVGEFENADKMYIDWDVFLKNNFDGTMNARGTQYQSIKTYMNNAAISIDGELRSMNNAVYTRTVSLMMTKFMRREEIFTQDIENINSYFISNYSKIYNMKKHYRQSVSEFKELLKEYDVPEKYRMINNYALLDAFIKSFELPAMTELLWEQLLSQINNMGASSIDQTIRTVCMIALQQKFPIYIDGDKNTMVIETSFDKLRYSSAKIDEIRSHIQIINHHFNPQGINLEDDLIVPLDYMMRTHALHTAFVKVLNHISRTTAMPRWHTIRAIREFAKSNNYTKQFFYEEANWNFAADNATKNNDTNDSEEFYM